MENPIIVVITDRNDLDGQLFGVFSLAQDLLWERPVQATTRPNSAEPTPFWHTCRDNKSGERVPGAQADHENPLRKGQGRVFSVSPDFGSLNALANKSLTQIHTQHGQWKNDGL